jgi:long-subunit acyl-CoA synthetase (AMP-forming)
LVRCRGPSSRATPFSIYNTYAPEQVQYQLRDAEARIFVTEKAFVDRLRDLKDMTI